MAKRKEIEKPVASATLSNVRLSAQKARLVVNMIRGLQIEPAIQVLAFSPKKGARMVEKLLRSAIMNAQYEGKVDLDTLWVTGAWVNAGKPIKRYMPRARGSANLIKKHSSHITITLGER